ncbi:MAG: hypothetical protein SGILL_000781 [Bacillariaceae sp.]
MQEILVTSSSPPSTPRPHYGNDRNENGFHSPAPVKASSTSPQHNPTARSILEMDRERRARREEAKGTILFWGNESSISNEEGSISSPEGIPSAAPNLNDLVPREAEETVGRGPRSHKRRRLSLRTGGSSDFSVRSTSSTETTLVAPTTSFLGLVPAPKTSYGPPTFAECGEYQPNGDSPFDYLSSPTSNDGMQANSDSMLMPSLTDDNGDGLVTPALPVLSTTNAFLPNHKRKFNRNGHFNKHSPTPNVMRRTSPLHFYHSQQQKTTTTSPPKARSNPLEDLVCHLRPRYSMSLEEEFSRQLSFRGMVGGH